MKKKNFILAFSSLFSIVGFAQNFEWVASHHGNGSANSFETEVDFEGNAYVIGTFDGTVDFDPGPETFEITSEGIEDFYIQKLDPTGNFVWAKTFGGALVDEAYSIEIDANNDLLIAGYFRDSVDFDPNAGEEYVHVLGDDPINADVFILKLNADGELIWVKSFGGNDDDNCFKIELDNSGNIYTTGAYHGTIDVDPSEDATEFTVLYDHGIFIQKLDAEGNLIWGKSIDGGPGGILSRDIAISEAGEVYINISFPIIIDVDPGDAEVLVEAVDELDAVMIKLNEDGEYLWHKHMGGLNRDLINQVILNSEGDAFVTGGFFGTVNFGSEDEPVEKTSNGNTDIYVMKVLSNGDLDWVNTYGASEADEGWGITLNSLGDVLVSGRFHGNIDFNEVEGEEYILETHGNYDAFFLTLTELGVLKLALNYGGLSVDYAYSVAVDNNDHIYLNGLFFGTADFNHETDESFNLSSGLLPDGYVLKLAGVLSIENSYDQKRLVAYPNPTNGILNIILEENTTEIDLKVYNLLGEIVFDKSYFNQKNIQLNLEELNPGTYYAVLNNNGTIYSISVQKL